MITDLIMDLIFSLINALILLISPLGDIFVPAGALEWFLNLILICGFILPLGTLLSIFAFEMSLTLFKLAYNFFFRIWDSLPFT